MQKKFVVGYIKSRAVEIEIKIKEGDNLSITGQVGQRSFGQIRDQLLDIDTVADGWTVGKIAKLYQIWKDWHLNDLIAGSPRQRQWIADNGGKGDYLNYTDICNSMPDDIRDDSEYLHNGKPYRYGSAWLRVDVPADILEWLRNL